MKNTSEKVYFQQRCRLKEEKGGEDKSQVLSFGLEKSIKRWHFVTFKMNATDITANCIIFDNFQIFYTKASLACTNCYFQELLLSSKKSHFHAIIDFSPWKHQQLSKLMKDPLRSIALLFNPFIGDGDSSMHRELCKIKIDRPIKLIEKDGNIGNAIKRMDSQLKSIVRDYKGNQIT